MKTALLLALALGFTLAPALAQDRPAIHGMLVFGKGPVYLSHLPMFHSPHDYQAIFRARLDPAATAAYVSDRAAGDERVYTIVPRPAVLPELAHAGAELIADVYRGHFERGGTLLVSAAHVRIEQVIFFRKLDPGAGHPPESRYLLFGQGSEAFVAHVIHGRPDFDQVLEARAPALPPEQLAHGTVLRLGGHADDEPLGEGSSFEGVELGRELYQEHGDLQ